MRFAIAFTVPLCAVTFGSFAAGAQELDAARPVPVTGASRVVGVGRARVVAVDERIVAGVGGQHGPRIDAARRALGNGDERTAAAELHQAANLLRLEATRHADRERGPLLEIAARIGTIGTDIEIGNVDEAQLDRRLSSTMRSLAGHHLALARAALARDEVAVAGEHLNTALDAFERALRWRGVDLDARTEITLDDARDTAAELKSALALAADVTRALDGLGQALDDEIAKAKDVRLDPADAANEPVQLVEPVFVPIADD